MNDLERYRNIFDGLKPWAGEVPQGYGVDFVGTLTHVSLLNDWPGDASLVGQRYVQTHFPTLVDDDPDPQRSFEIGNWNGERWFEAVNWFVAARAARSRFVMITLGAWHGSQAVGSYRTLHLVNPMPCRLVVVEPVPENVAATRRHFSNNGIDPAAHWFIPLAISDRNDPVFFTIGPRNLGSQNCFSTNERQAREHYFRYFQETGRTEQAFRNLVLTNSTGLLGRRSIGGELTFEENAAAQIKFVSAVTLGNVLGPFDVVDYLESDIQESEILVFPPFIDLLRKKVRRIHIGTHGKAVHASLHDLFARSGWEIVFSYEPETEHHTSMGSFRTGDGVLTVSNPDL